MNPGPPRLAVTMQLRNRRQRTRLPELSRSGGAGETRGTIRMLTKHDLTLTNLRDRELPTPRDKIGWAPVVILDHP